MQCLLSTLHEIKSDYQLEAKIQVNGENIGKCGSYLTRATIEAACTFDSTCVGYTMKQIYDQSKRGVVAK